MPEVPNFKNYVRRAMKEHDNRGEGTVEGGLTAPVDLMNIGYKQNIQFHRDGVRFADMAAERQDALVARLNELNAMLPPEEADDLAAQRGNLNQAIGEVFGATVFDLETLLKCQATELEKISNMLTSDK